MRRPCAAAATATAIIAATLAAAGLAMTPAGLYAWGQNGEGQLGNGTATTRTKPVGVELPTDVKVTAISAGGDSSYALTSSGHVLAWGLNEEGQLGNGTSTSSDQPVQVHLPAGLAATAVFSGESAFFAVALVGKS